MVADFFVFLGSFVADFIKPIFALIKEPKIGTFLGSNLLFILIGFWIIHVLYNIFISHPDYMQAKTETIHFDGGVKATPYNNRQIATYSSAYKQLPSGK